MIERIDWSDRYPWIEASESYPRDDLMRRTLDWLGLEDPLTPVLLLQSGPGTGKSTFVTQLLRRIMVYRSATGPAVIGVRHGSAEHRDPFDATRLLNDIVRSLGVLADPVEGSSRMVDSGLHIESLTINQQVSGPRNVAIAVAMNMGSIDGLLAAAQSAIARVPKTQTAVIILDALDQAEDETFATPYLEVVGALADSARGTGVRLVCTSTRDLPIGIPRNLCTTMSGESNAALSDSEIRSFVVDSLKALMPVDAARIADGITAGARGNWLWAAINTQAVLSQFHETNTVPAVLKFSEGLSGLHADMWNRARRKLAPTELPQARDLVAAVSVAVDGHLGWTELRYVLNVGFDYYTDLLSKLSPMIQSTATEDVFVHHPDAARWVLGGGIAGVNLASAHNKLARGLVELGRNSQWGDATARYAGPNVLGHLCASLVLDSLNPVAKELENAIAEIVFDKDWVAHSGDAGSQVVREVGTLRPALTLPNTEIPVGFALNRVTSSAAGAILVGFHLSNFMTDEEIERFGDVMGEQVPALEYLESVIPNHAEETFKVVWASLLSGHLVVSPQPPYRIFLGLGALTHGSILETGMNHGYTLELVQLINPQELDAWAALLTSRGLDETVPADGRLSAHVQLAHILVEQISEDAGRATELEPRIRQLLRSASKISGAMQSARFNALVEYVNTVHVLEHPSLADLDELIEAQAELLDLRRSNNEIAWPLSANRLGQAYSARAALVRSHASAESAPPRDAANEAEVATTYDNQVRLDDAEALKFYRLAFENVDRESPSALSLAADLADTLLRLEDRSMDQVSELIEVQAEIVRMRRGANDPEWPHASHLLGLAYHDRAIIRLRADEPEALEDLSLSIHMEREAYNLSKVFSTHTSLTYAIGLANSLLLVPDLDREQCDELIAVQAVIFNTLRSTDGEDWLQAAALLADVFRRRSALSGDDLALELDPDDDLRQAVALYRLVLSEGAPDDARRTRWLTSLAAALDGLRRKSLAQWDELIDVLVDLEAVARDGSNRSFVECVLDLASAYASRAAVIRLAAVQDRSSDSDDLAALDLYRKAYMAATDVDLGRNCGSQLATALGSVRKPEQDQVDELVAVRAELLERETRLELTPLAMALLGDAHVKRARFAIDNGRTVDEVMESLNLAVDQFRLARVAPHDDEVHVEILTRLANCLHAMPQRSAIQVKELIEVDMELVALLKDLDDPRWVSAARLLGSLYAASPDSDPEAEALSSQDLTEMQLPDFNVALEWCRKAYDGAPTPETRLDAAITYVEVLSRNPDADLDTLGEIVVIQTEVVRLQELTRDSRQSNGLNSLGDAHMMRYEALRRIPGGAEASEDQPVPTSSYREDQAVAELELAIGHYRRALILAGYTDSPEQMQFAADLADALAELDDPTREQLDELVAIQGAVADTRRSAEDPSWPVSVALRAAALMRRRDALTEGVPADDLLATNDTVTAVECYRAALPFIQGEDSRRDEHLDGFVLALRLLPLRSLEEVNELVLALTELVALQEAAGDLRSVVSANLLGDAYYERAGLPGTQSARTADLIDAVHWYRVAYDRAPDGGGQPLVLAVDLANALVALSAVTRTDAASALAEAVEVVRAKVGFENRGSRTLRSLLPVVMSALRRADGW